MTTGTTQEGVTGKVLLEAGFDDKISIHGRIFISLIFVITIVGIPLLPFWWLFSLWYYPEYLRRLTARVTTQAV